MEPKSPSKHKFSIKGSTQYKRVLKMIVIISFGLSFLLAGFYFAFKSGEGQFQRRVFKGSYYTVVVDSGSTGTRVSVYEWESRGENERELPILLNSYPDNSTKSSLVKGSCKYHCMQTEPGLDKFVGNTSGVRASLEPLIAWAERMVPLERHCETPIFVLATAGLRRLAVEDARRVLEDIEDVMKERSFLYRRSWIRVLSGKEEAYYGWVALNYKMGIFRNYSRSPSLGLLDLGGSSLQVVMEIESEGEDTHLVRSKFGFIEHWILAYSLPAFGLNEAFDRAVVLLSHTEALRENRDGALELRHPCYGSDFVQNYTCRGCFGLNVAEQKSTSQMEKIEYPSLCLVGAPNWQQCRMLARAAAMNLSSLDWPWLAGGEDDESRLSFEKGNGILNLTASARTTPRFHALSGFFAVFDTLNLSPKARLTKIWEKGRELCSRSWANKSRISENQYHAAHYCFRVPYVASLLEDALHLGDKEIWFGPPDVSWALGAALVEGEYLWLVTSSSQSSTLTSYIKIMSSPFFVFVVLVCLLLIVYHSQVKLPMLGGKLGTSSHSYIYPRGRPN